MFDLWSAAIASIIFFREFSVLLKVYFVALIAIVSKNKIMMFSSYALKYLIWKVLLVPYRVAGSRKFSWSSSVAWWQPFTFTALRPVLPKISAARMILRTNALVWIRWHPESWKIMALCFLSLQRSIQSNLVSCLSCHCMVAHGFRRTACLLGLVARIPFLYSCNIDGKPATLINDLERSWCR